MCSKGIVLQLIILIFYLLVPLNILVHTDDADSHIFDKGNKNAINITREVQALLHVLHKVLIIIGRKVLRQFSNKQ